MPVKIIASAGLVFPIGEVRTDGTVDVAPRNLLPWNYGLEDRLDRRAKPTGANILAAFQGLDLIYTQRGSQLDPFTPTQRRLLDSYASSRTGHSEKPRPSELRKRG